MPGSFLQQSIGGHPGGPTPDIVISSPEADALAMQDKSVKELSPLSADGSQMQKTLPLADLSLGRSWVSVGSSLSRTPPRCYRG